MKINILLILIFLFTSCISQKNLTYVDDAYYYPGDEIASSTKKVIIISEISDEDGANKMKNYIYADKEPDWYSRLK